MTRLQSAVRFISPILISLMLIVAPLPSAGARQVDEPSLPLLVEWRLVEMIDMMRGGTPAGDAAQYSVRFLPDGEAQIVADCVDETVSYEAQGPVIAFGPIASLGEECGADSQAGRFLEELSYVRSFLIEQESGSDELVLVLMADGGFLRFAPALTGVTWQWRDFEGGDGATIQPDDPSRYTVTFESAGDVTAILDCNKGSGRYETENGSIELDFVTTEIACGPSSLGEELGRYLSEASTYVIRDGLLALALPMDAGIVTFQPFLPEDVPGSPESEDDTEANA
jgi:heat shock protein HslJ